jgi:putative heme-binding domain-containing protein
LAIRSVILLVLFALLGSRAGAQHATAYDVEDGSRAYENVCANCHGPDGDLIAGIDLGRGLFRRDFSDDELVEIILNGIPNTPMPATPQMSEEQAQRIVDYLRSTAAARPEDTIAGDPQRGRALFENEGQCLDCHEVDGRGSRLGPDLSRIGTMRRVAELERSLLDPQAEIQPTNRFVTIAPARGPAVTGRLLNQDPFSVQIIDETERLRSFDKSTLESVEFTESPMPTLEGELDAQEIADIVSYLASLRGPTQ